MRCVQLRGGDGHPLFVFPGLGGEASELAPFAAALEAGRPVIGVEPFEPLDDRAGSASVERMAEIAVALIKERQLHGPYLLLGYSFGGLIALEVSQTLRHEGERVAFVGLVDVIYDRRYWPFRLFARASARRTAHHLGRIVRERAWVELVSRGRRLGRHLAARKDPAGSALSGVLDRQGVSSQAMGQWRPRTIDGHVVLFSSGGREDFACDPAKLWAPWIDDLEVRGVAGSHLRLVRDADSVVALAQAVDRELERTASEKLRVMLATVFPWESSGRLAVELARVGCVVDAIAPPNSAIHRLRQVRRTYRLGRIRPLRALRLAILESRADLVVPFDDRTRHALHELHRRADPRSPSGARLRAVIEASLGPPETYSWIYSRAAVMAVAAECGVSCPATAVVADGAEVVEWMNRRGGAVVLKTDGSWGGREVAIVRDVQTAARAWRWLSRPQGWTRGAKRFLLDRDPWPLRSRLTRRRPVVSVQAYVEGSPANIAAACLDGELLGAVQVDVVCSDGVLGPATVIKVIDDREMLAAAATMVRQLRLTGLCGFDFVRESETRVPYLVEVNPRATPTVHLLAGDGADPLTLWRAKLGYGGPPARTGAYPGGLVALYPQEMRRDPQSPFLEEAHHDVPLDCPELVAHPMSGRRRDREVTKV